MRVVRVALEFHQLKYSQGGTYFFVWSENEKYKMLRIRKKNKQFLEMGACRKFMWKRAMKIVEPLQNRKN